MLQTTFLRRVAPVHWHPLLFVGGLRAFVGPGMEVECLVLEPAGDWVAWVKSPRQPLPVRLRASVSSCSSLDLGELGRAETVGPGKVLGTVPMTPVISPPASSGSGGGRWRLAFQACGSGVLGVSTCSGLPLRVPRCAPHLPCGCSTGQRVSRNRASKWPARLAHPQGPVVPPFPLLAFPAQAVVPLTAVSCLLP